jgi:peptidyl-prolyl cis-trans isomerase D
MLEAIRTRLSGWVSFVIIGFIGLALVISFGNMDSGINPELVVAEVNGEEIFVQQVRQSLDSQVKRYQDATGQDVPPFLKAQLAQNVLDSIIDSRLLLQYVNKSGYRVSDATVAAAIRSMEAFKVDGEFSQQTYEALLLSQGLSPQLFEEDRRRDLQMRQLQAVIVDSAFVTPSDYRRFLELEAETRDISFLAFNAASYESEVTVSEESVAEYYAANGQEFETDETIDVEFIELKLANIAATVEVDDAMVQNYYDENIDRFRTETERKASHILIATDEQSDADALNQANKVLGLINAGEDFEVLAAEYSADPGSAAMGGDLGWSASGVFVPEFETALFELQKGEVSMPVKTQFGYHVIKLIDIRPGAEEPLSEVRESLLATLARDEAEELFYSASERLDDLSLESLDGLAMVAEDMGLELKLAVDVPRIGGTIGLPVSEQLQNALFSLEVLEDGENTPLIEIEPGHVLVARVTRHNLPQPRPIDEVAPGIRVFLVSQEAASLASAAADAVLLELQEGNEIAAVATANDVELQSEQAVSRGSRELPPELVSAVFEAPKPNDVPAPQVVLSPNGSVLILQIDSVVPGKPSELSRDERDERKTQLERMVGQSQVAALVQSLREAATIRMFDDIMQDPEVL